MNLFTGPFDDMDLSINTDMVTIVRAMARPESGLEIRDRMWLKITIPNAFIGADVVDWLNTHVKGFIDRSVIQSSVRRRISQNQCCYINTLLTTLQTRRSQVRLADVESRLH